MKIVFEDRLDGVMLSRLFNNPQWNEAVDEILTELEKHGYDSVDFENELAMYASNDEGIIDADALLDNIISNGKGILEDFIEENPISINAWEQEESRVSKAVRSCMNKRK